MGGCVAGERQLGRDKPGRSWTTRNVIVVVVVVVVVVLTIASNAAATTMLFHVEYDDIEE
jgi:hypothetical protein